MILTHWTIRVALLFYAAAVALLLRKRRAAARSAWTAGCLFYLAHVASAFQFFHHWSHAAAYRETARQTEALFGFNWGGGIYWNYVFTGVWVADAAWWWARPDQYRRRPRWVSGAVHGFLAFMAFQGTVVFATGIVRWAGLIAAILLAALCWQRFHERAGL